MSHIHTFPGQKLPRVTDFQMDVLAAAVRAPLTINIRGLWVSPEGECFNPLSVAAVRTRGWLEEAGLGKAGRKTITITPRGREALNLLTGDNHAK